MKRTALPARRQPPAAYRCCSSTAGPSTACLARWSTRGCRKARCGPWARFVEGRDADRLWGLLGQGFPLNLSLGAAVVAVEPQGPNGHGGTHYRAERWRLTEVSVVVRGQRQEAQVRLLDRDESLPELAARLGPGEDAARQAVRRSLHLERGLAWAGEVAPALVAELGVPPDRLRSLLWVEVAGHGEELVRSLAVPVLARADVGAA